MPRRSPAEKFWRYVQRSFALPRKRPLHIRMHLIIAVLAIAVLSGLGLLDRATFSTQNTKAEETVIKQIGIEHESTNASAVMILARKGPVGYASVENTSPAAIAISLPQTWKRAEVTGATISEVQAGTPEFGMIRWTLPAGAGMKLFFTDVPSTLQFLSPSQGTIAVTLHAIDLVNNTHNTSVVLLQQSGNAENLWERKQ